MPQEPCPICATPARTQPQDYSNKRDVECAVCGHFIIFESAALLIDADDRKRAILSHAIFRMTFGGSTPVLTKEIVSSILNTGRIPAHFEQADNFINFVGNFLEQQERLSGTVDIPKRKWRSAIGALTDDDVAFVTSELISLGLIRAEKPIPTLNITEGAITIMSHSEFAIGLTFKGWDRFRELQKGSILSRTAFMAMHYGDSDLDEMYQAVFSPAVKATGFHLSRLDEVPKAGVIDNNLRVAIRNARFLLVDLTHGNQGAYWEGGFAEGLGRPAIYLCEKSVFEHKEKNRRPHFDTNHCQTVVWESSNKTKAMADIKNCIRATLPSEAKMTDEQDS